MTEQQGEYQYLTGFGNEFASEALPGALPKSQNNPQKCAYGLYCEQLSGTAFTAPRGKNQRSWLYRIRPPVQHMPFEKIESELFASDFHAWAPNPNQMRWNPAELPWDDDKVDFIAGLKTMAGAGDPCARHGTAIHMYCCNTSMKDKCMYNSDGDFLIVPQEGTLVITTEFGVMEVGQNEIAVIQRGIRFSVAVSQPSRGYINEIFAGHFELPSLGPIGE